MNTRELHVIWGTGPLGLWTMRELLRLGKRVRMINRRGMSDTVPSNVEVVKGDGTDARSACGLSEGATAVYQCAQPAYERWSEEFPTLQANILEGAATNNAKLIIGENLYMYGDTNGRPLTEDMPNAAHTKKGMVRAAMAETALQAHRSGKVQVAIGRASDFFGPDDYGWGDRLFRAAVQGKRVAMLGRLDQPHTWSYVPDFGKALAILGTRDEALGHVWHIPSSEPITGATLIDLIATELSSPVKVMLGRPLLLRGLGLFNPAMREQVELLYAWTKPFNMDSTKFQRAFGVQPTPLHTAVHETLQWVRARLPR